jgi:hypothetical protein
MNFDENWAKFNAPEHFLNGSYNKMLLNRPQMKVHFSIEMFYDKLRNF